MLETTLFEKLTTFSLNTSQALPRNAIEIISMSLFDWLVVGLAGQNEPVSLKLRNYARDTGGNPEASLFGTDHKTTCRMAALVNGTTSHALDYDDTHFAYIGHPSTVIFPTLLALAEKQDQPMGVFLEASAVGFEAACRTGIWLGREHYQIGYHQTSTAGSIGATLAAARLIGLTASETSHALGLVSSRASGLKSQFGTMGKPLNAGFAAANAVESVTLAKYGVTSNPTALAGQNGFAETHHAAQDTKAAIAGLGSVYIFEGVSHKYHACCHGLHASLEALRKAILEQPFTVEELGSVRIKTHPRWLTVCNIAEPKTALETKFSYRHTAALLVAGYDTGMLEVYSDALAEDDKLRAIRKRVKVVPDKTVDEMASEIEIQLTDGTVLQSKYDLGQPVSHKEMRRRLMQKASALLGGDKAEHILQATRSNSGSISKMVHILRDLG
jgi:2-methylcitrate dehydratase PrpD